MRWPSSATPRHDCPSLHGARSSPTSSSARCRAAWLFVGVPGQNGPSSTASAALLLAVDLAGLDVARRLTLGQPPKELLHLLSDRIRAEKRERQRALLTKIFSRLSGLKL
ncbi:MAG: hypothetical protein U5R31_07660 [Acidimicrobiia bacterium]|nr:hypothetical protein [Acidimicrobiia bacterium]